MKAGFDFIVYLSTTKRNVCNKAGMNRGLYLDCTDWAFNFFLEAKDIRSSILSEVVEFLCNVDGFLCTKLKSTVLL